MELKDIVLEKGDKITFTDNKMDIVDSGEEGEKVKDVFFEDKIAKIERPVKYETIYEAPKKILDKINIGKFLLEKEIFLEIVMNI